MADSPILDDLPKPPMEARRRSATSYRPGVDIVEVTVTVDGADR